MTTVQAIFKDRALRSLENTPSLSKDSLLFSAIYLSFGASQMVAMGSVHNQTPSPLRRGKRSLNQAPIPHTSAYHRIQSTIVRSASVIPNSIQLEGGSKETSSAKLKESFSHAYMRRTGGLTVTTKSDWTREELEKDIVGKYTALTVPINVRIEGQQKVLGLNEMEKILKEAKLISLGDCGCRSQLKKCDAPLDVCICLDKEAEAMIKKGHAKQASLRQALNALKRSHAAGLVHIAYTVKGDEKANIVCSCCSCCCHSMSALVRFGMPEAVVASKYIAVNNPETCINCGTCVERCQFKARRMENDKLVFDNKRCFGCGLCITMCPTKSITFKKRN